MIATRDATGLYVARFNTAVLGAALAANAVVAAIRNGPTSNAKSVRIIRIDVDFDTLVAFTAAQQFGFYAQRFDTANCAGGSAITPAKLRSTSDPASACTPGGGEGGDIRVATTAALTTTGVVFDTADAVPLIAWTDPAAGKKTAGKGLQADLAAPDFGFLTLAAGQGLAIRNLIVWPAAGTGVLAGAIYWAEV